MSAEPQTRAVAVAVAGWTSRPTLGWRILLTVVVVDSDV